MESRAKHTPGPWNVGQGHPHVIYHDCHPVAYTTDGNHSDWIIPNPLGKAVAEANAALIALAPEMADLLRETENAEDAHANCEECSGEGIPELCEECFPLFDAVRVKRRSILARLKGKS